MRKFMFMMLMVLIIAGVAPFMLPLKDGRPLLNYSDLKLPKAPTLPEVSLPDIALPEALKPNNKEETAAPQPDKVEMYRWRDAEGVVHFEDVPPQGVAYETVRINPNRNSMAALRPPKPAEPDAASSPSGTKPTGQLTSPYSPEGVKSLMDQARGVEGMLQDRRAQQDRALGM